MTILALLDLLPSRPKLIQTNIADAIARSVSHNEIVCCLVTSLTRGLHAVGQHAELDGRHEIGQAPRPLGTFRFRFDGSLFDSRAVDVWGTTYDGAEFRLFLISE